MVHKAQYGADMPTDAGERTPLSPDPLAHPVGRAADCDPIDDWRPADRSATAHADHRPHLEPELEAPARGTPGPSS